MTRHPRSREAADLLKANAVDFLNSGVELLLTDQNASQRRMKAAVLSVQTSIELFAKFRIVQERGLQEIVRKGSIPMKGDLLQSAQNNSFSTIGFDQCLEKIYELESVGEWERSLISELQKLRNTLVHFSAAIEARETRGAAVASLVHVLALFATGIARDEPELTTYRVFLDPELYDLLLSEPSYLADAFDAATSDPDALKIFRCWECDAETLTLRPSDAYFCWTCGLGADANTVGMATCAVCGREEVYYDLLNDDNGYHLGRCMHCKIMLRVSECSSCGSQMAAPPTSLAVCECESLDNI